MLDPMVCGGLVAVGVVLMVIEVLAPGRTFMAIPGSFLASLGVIGLATRSETFTFGTGIMIAAIVGILVAFLTFARYNSMGRSGKKGKAAAMVGKTGKVTKRIPRDGTGKVRLGKVSWKAKSDGPIEAGRMVEVVDMKGVYLVVVESDGPVARDEEE